MAALGGSLLLAAAGCGGGSFREQARDICADYAERIEAVGRPADYQELARTAGEIADLLEAQIGELRELEPPDDRAGDWQRWLTLSEGAVENAREIQEAAGENDQQRIVELADEAAQTTLTADRLARDLDLPECMVESEDVEPGDGGPPVVTVGTDG